MLVIGNWASDRIAASAQKGAAEAGAIFLQAFLQPFVQDLPQTGTISAEVADRLDANLASGDSMKRFVMLKIWRLDRTLLYSSIRDIPPVEVVEEEIQLAASGQLARHFEELDEEVLNIPPEENVRLLEVYAPLYKTGTDQVIAVGEFYQSAERLIRDEAETRFWTWIVVALTTVSMLAILYLHVRRGSTTIENQRIVLREHFLGASRLARQNERLRRAAEQARVDASEGNENFLSRLGAEIHDGPIQTLSLLMLSLQYGRDGSVESEPQEGEGAQPDSDGRSNRISLARSLHAELRNLSSGLVLPELGKASLSETIEIAITRYSSATGLAVGLHLEQLPDQAPHAVKICVYRIIQEALRNGFRHAGGAEQRVAAKISGPSILVVVSDEGPGFDPKSLQEGKRIPLGLVGMTNRVRALKGRLRVRSVRGRGTMVVVSLPLDQAG